MQVENRCRLYVITPPKLEEGFTESAKCAFAGGDIACLQLRLKGASDEEILRWSERLVPICQEHGAAFILNDRPDLAKKAVADGVHLGQDDGTVAAAREIMGEEAVIGVSCHDSGHLAMEAAEQGADYVAFGAFYPTTSKSPEAMKRWGMPKPDILEWWSTWTEIPCAAIGGITPENCAPLVKAGADFIAVISAIWNHPQGPDQAVKEFNAVLRGDSSVSV